jgi:predicted RNA methylase
MACCCDFTDTVDRQFTNKKAGQELHRYRRKGAGPTTRLLIDGISRAGVADGSLLDIGAGVGALTFELLERGFDRTVVVEASAGYRAAASSEAVRRGRSPQVEFVSGDFLEAARTVPAASVVALDRVCAAIRCSRHCSSRPSVTPSVHSPSTREIAGTSEPE